MSYELGLRIDAARWRSVVAIVAAVLMLIAALALVIPLGGAIDMLIGRTPMTLDDFRLTPGTWLAGAIGLALLIPGSRLVQARLFQVPGGELSSIEGRVRVGWAARVALVVVPVFLLVAVALFGIAPQGPWRGEFVPLAIAALLLTPLQAAGEEWLFRGLMARALATLPTHRAVALSVSLAGSTVLFWIGHGASAPFSVVYYLAAGVGLWLTAEWTGGLEAGCVMHACANVFLVVPALLGGGLGSPTALGGPLLLGPAAVWLVMPFALAGMARRAGVTVTAGR